MKLHRIASLFTVILFVQVLCAENGMNSPYTRYGFGQLATMEVGANKGMGGTGIGVRNNSQINMLNPASYAAVDTLTFLLDIADRHWVFSSYIRHLSKRLRKYQNRG